MEATKKGFDFKKFMSDNAMWFVLIILAVALTAVRPRFATVGNLTTLISSESVKGIITCGVCWCILSAGIDLGPGAVAALSAVVSASLAQQADLRTYAGSCLYHRCYGYRRNCWYYLRLAGRLHTYPSVYRDVGFTAHMSSFGKDVLQ